MPCSVQRRLGGGDLRQLTVEITALGKRSSWQLAALAFQELRPQGLQPDIVAFTATASALAGQWPLSFLVLDELRRDGLQADALFCGKLLVACEKAKGWSLALALLRGRPALTSQARGAAVNICKDVAGTWPWALQLLAEFQLWGPEPSLIPYNTAATACQRGGQWTLALQLLQHVGQVSFEPDLVSCGVALRSLAEGACWASAVDLLLRGMGERDEVAFGSAITACERASQATAALRLLAMLRCSRTPSSAVPFNAALSACDKAKFWEEALDMLGSMGRIRMPPDRLSFNAAISACGRSAYWALAGELLRTMRQQPGLRPDSVTCGALTSAYQRAERWDSALLLLRELPRSELGLAGGDVCAFSATLAALASAGEEGRASRWRTVVKVLGEMRFQQLVATRVTCNAALTALAAHGRWEQAIGLFVGMRAQLLEFDVVAVSAAGRSMAHGRQWGLLVELLLSLPRWRVLPNPITYQAALESMAGSLGGSGAERLAPELTEASQRLGLESLAAWRPGSGRW
ncbi:unnamed protein product [Polarella glacialis]|uniref:Pentatricopeptide repeat-containing protein, chloroplastic n=1 Tax=Polarella glacialis TaxID=89957 RepID=A0A813F292_POLGL|nr:unnamed protein product [Polarella glacialis]